MFKSKSSKLHLSDDSTNDLKLKTDEDFRAINGPSSTTRTELEIENHAVWRQKKSFRIALISVFSALAVVLGYILAFLINIEVFTLFIFMSGFVLSKKEGTLIGLISSAIFTFFNPMGSSAASPPLFVYQLIHYSSTGFLGGLTKDFLKAKSFYKPNEDLYVFQIMLIFGTIGGIITFSYDILSTLIGGFISLPTIGGFFSLYLSGIIFTSIHLVGNILGFVFILPGLIQIIIKIID
ncbi:MAG: hypothetical protein P8Y23_13880 [Candidatus Lokiarchaeota archaeon]|jgi:uncharacterized membrane protein